MTTLKCHHASFGLVKGIGTVAFIFFSVFYGVIFAYGLFLPFVVVWPWLFRRTVEVMGAVWQTILVVRYSSLSSFERYTVGCTFTA